MKGNQNVHCYYLQYKHKTKLEYALLLSIHESKSECTLSEILCIKKEIRQPEMNKNSIYLFTYLKGLSHEFKVSFKRVKSAKIIEKHLKGLSHEIKLYFV